MNGVLLVDKDQGMTSHDVVAKARRILGIRGIGHAGTLDPMASGLLCLLVGEATKISDYLLNCDKGYRVVVQLGVKTDSMDITGQVLETKPVQVSEADVRKAIAEATGALSLEVPVHSAVKVDGKKLYEMAHRGERPDSLPVREMTFFGMEILGIHLEEAVKSFEVQFKCSKGSFVRAWANHVGGQLGCGGTVSVLRRVLSEPFAVESAKSLGELEKAWEARQTRSGVALGEAWIDLADALPQFGRIEVAGQDATLLGHGQISKGLQAELLRSIQLGEQPRPMRIIHREERRLLALLTAEPGQFYKIRRVFPQS